MKEKIKGQLLMFQKIVCDSLDTSCGARIGILDKQRFLLLRCLPDTVVIFNIAEVLQADSKVL